MKKIILSAFIFTFFDISHANESKIFMIESLLREGDLDKAEFELSGSNLEKSVYYKLSGRLASLKSEDLKALGMFQKSRKFGDQSEALSLMLAQTYLKLNKNDEALGELKSIKSKSVQKDLLWAQALWQKRKDLSAIDHLSNLESRGFSSYDLIERQKLYYLYELGLIKKMFTAAADYYKNPGASSEVGLYAVSLLKEKDGHLAEAFFDFFLKFKSKDALVLKERGVFEIEKGRNYTASLFFSRAAHQDPKYAYEAAASQLDLGNYSQAKFFNTKVKDDKKRLVQLFSIYIDNEEFEPALSMKYEMEKAGLLDDDKILYALMYTAFKVRDYKTFNDYFYKVKSKNFIAKALKLKQIVESCKENMEPQCVFS